MLAWAKAACSHSVLWAGVPLPLPLEGGPWNLGQEGVWKRGPQGPNPDPLRLGALQPQGPAFCFSAGRASEKAPHFPAWQHLVSTG